jgi:hypothetical protein
MSREKMVKTHAFVRVYTCVCVCVWEIQLMRNVALIGLNASVITYLPATEVRVSLNTYDTQMAG